MQNSPRAGALRRAGAATSAAVLVLTLASCGLFGDGDESPPSEPLASATTEELPAEDGLAAYYQQQPEWRECRSDMECTEVEVPIDYEDPFGESITLSVLRVPATDQDARVGSLLVNPGGPGGSGVDYAASAEVFFGDRVRAAFDIVGFDPRGVGESTPVDCVSDQALDEYVASDPDPESTQEAEEVLDGLRRMGQGCLDMSGNLARHMSTEEAARDMDVLRAVLGQEQLAYFGASYGTYLGAWYADLFPDRVGRMVLDGAIDPQAGEVEASLIQAEGFETALRAYIGACVDGGDCFLGDTVDEGAERIQQFLEELDASPIPGSGDRQLTEGLAVLGIWAPLYNESSWPSLDEALKTGFAGDGRFLMLLADAYVSRGPEGYVNNSTEALYAVNCSDPGEDISLADAEKEIERFEEVSPTFGRGFAYGLAACSAWPVDGPTEQEPLDAPGSEPIMVVGTSRDPATPLRWAEALADQLDSAVLVRRDGDGHTGYNAGNDCVDEAVEAYLVSGTVPPDTVDC
ncbi:alpha/beta hydrolase [Nocardioides caldifontis]|uniref:alpha/beta hydrolase n=1 Tax=Nocardioides caldifontis TaxID=2588938 RepID=UPI0011DF7D85|nr:alpha/beta hydrolase [Nocardioides caldifontis]